MKFNYCILLLLLLGYTVAAQEQVNALTLEMKPNAQAPATLVAAAEGRANSKGQHIKINVPDMFKPLLITVLSVESKKPLNVTLHTDSWKNAEMKAVTDADGYCEFKVRAQNALGIKIVSEEESDYLLVAYLGEEKMPDMPTPFSNKKNNATAEAKVTTPEQKESGKLTYILIGVGVLIAVLLLVLIRRRGVKSVLPALLLFASATAYGQTEVSGKSDIEIRAEAERRIKERNKQVNEKLKTGGEKMEKAAKLLISGAELWQSYKNLNTCMSSAALPGMPSVPSFCEEADSSSSKRGSEPCAECFKEARKEFNEVRYKFIKLQTIYRCTKSFADKAKSFGDDVSSIHAVQGLAWQAEKRKIEQSLDKLKKSYDDKYIDLLQRLHNSMMKLDECEAKFGQKNWFDSYGFIFYEFMKESYRRKDE